MGSDDARRLLARRLRQLREQHWPDIKITQAQLAAALGAASHISVPLMSSWESARNPKIPPVPRLEAYATFFATRRSVTGAELRLLDVHELTKPERETRDKLAKELLRLRAQALPRPVLANGAVAQAMSSDDYYQFDDGAAITIVCAQLPDHMLLTGAKKADPADPHYITLSAFADLDALFELHGHIRAANPLNEVHVRTSQQMNYPQPVMLVGRVADDYSMHLVLLGGVDWNLATRAVLNSLRLPVRQLPDWESPEGPFFEVEADGAKSRHYSRLAPAREREVIEDVALFARAVNPFNRERTVTICNGIHGSGTFGAVRALTDRQFRSRNTEYARKRFGDSDMFCILTRVTLENGVPLTPDWTIAENRLFEWSGNL